MGSLQGASFTRTYATYGGVFIIMSLGWGWIDSGLMPNKFEFFGAFLALVGAIMIFSNAKD
jgi:small multidrug resistance family-3 protein